MEPACEKPRLVVIVGPTAAGKTELSLRLAEERGGEIVSADSMQVYRYLDIGTAKPSLQDRLRVRHHLIDVVYPDEPYHASLFVGQAGNAIAKLHRKGQTIVVTGGTGLYVKALLGGLFAGPGADEEIRSFYREELARHGCVHLYRLLRVRDPRAADIISPADAIRIMRALEVLDLCGESIVALQTRHGFHDRPYDAVKIGVRVDRAELNRRIAERTHRMMAQGFPEEVEEILRRGYDPTLKPLRAIGYRQVVRYLQGRVPTLTEATAAVIQETRRYAKRQMTWFAADKDITWFDSADFHGIKEKAGKFLESRGG
jgi:tRNA dimethylallyltransferase